MDTIVVAKSSLAICSIFIENPQIVAVKADGYRTTASVGKGSQAVYRPQVYWRAANERKAEVHIFWNYGSPGGQNQPFVSLLSGGYFVVLVSEPNVKKARIRSY